MAGSSCATIPKPVSHRVCGCCCQLRVEPGARQGHVGGRKAAQAGAQRMHIKSTSPGVPARGGVAPACPPRAATRGSPRHPRPARGTPAARLSSAPRHPYSTPPLRSASAPTSTPSPASSRPECCHLQARSAPAPVSPAAPRALAPAPFVRRRAAPRPAYNSPRLDLAPRRPRPRGPRIAAIVSRSSRISSPSLALQLLPALQSQGGMARGRIELYF